MTPAADIDGDFVIVGAGVAGAALDTRARPPTAYRNSAQSSDFRRVRRRFGSGGSGFAS